jgi:hypothetical protein
LDGRDIPIGIKYMFGLFLCNKSEGEFGGAEGAPVEPATCIIAFMTL